MSEILITGVLPENSGKTTLAEDLIREAREEGFDVGVSKPVCSTNGWYYPEVIKKSSELGFLVGRDVLRLHRAAKSEDSMELENPVCSLAMPVDPEKFEWNLDVTLSSYQIALIRVTGDERMHFLVSSNLERFTNFLRNETQDLVESLEGEVEEIEMEEIESVLEEARMTSNKILRRMRKRYEVLFVESFSNVASPNEEALNSDVVIAVAPGRAAVYDGERYRKAMEILSDLRAPWEISTSDVIRFLRPLKIEF